MARACADAARNSKSSMGTGVVRGSQLLVGMQRSNDWGSAVGVDPRRSAAYGKFNDGFTSTMMKADPSARIVAVDPKLIPYGSNVWIEGLGWYNAQDCGSAIKGYRLDVMANSEHDAMGYGKQDRFVIV